MISNYVLIIPAWLPALHSLTAVPWGWIQLISSQMVNSSQFLPDLIAKFEVGQSMGLDICIFLNVVV